MKLVSLIVFLSSLWFIETRRVRTNKVECGSSNRTAVKVHCYLKAYDRKNPLINGEYTTTRTLANSLTFLGFYRKSGTNYDSILTLPDLPICKLFGKSSTTMLFSPFIQLMVKSFEEQLGNFFESCKRVGEFITRNVSIQDMPALTQYPNGQYKVVFRLFDEIDDNIVNTTLFMTVLG